MSAATQWARLVESGTLNKSPRCSSSRKGGPAVFVAAAAAVADVKVRSASSESSSMTITSCAPDILSKQQANSER